MVKKKSNRQIFLRCMLTLLSQLGSSMFVMGVSLFIFQKTNSSISFGINMIIGPLVTVLLSPIIGKIIDFFSHKRIIIINQIISALSLILYAFFFQTVENQILALTIALVIVLKVSDEFVLLSLYASSITIVLEEDQQKLRSWQQISANFSAVASPIIGALLYGIIPFNFFILSVVLLELFSLVIVILIDFQLVSKEEVPQSQFDNKNFKVFKWFVSQSALRSIVFLATVVTSLDAVIYIATPIIILKVLNLPNLFYSIAMSALIVGELFASFILSKRKQEKMPLKNGYTIMIYSTLLLSLLGFSTIFESKYISFLILIISLFSTVFIESFFTIPLQVWYVTEVPEAIQGRVFAFLGAIISFFSPISTFLFSIFYEIKFLPTRHINLLIISVVVLFRLLTIVYLKFLKKVNLGKAHVTIE
ncbi:MFS transporter [Streptococcus dysgalactiae]|uniref:MFS transporter n=1 Tax=Streptococcus dysgalactiae TaxID=1334 RepID=UPI0022B6145B|nr:MFS transporter [Streptococcus dysgalactiae]